VAGDEAEPSRPSVLKTIVDLNANRGFTAARKRGVNDVSQSSGILRTNHVSATCCELVSREIASERGPRTHLLRDVEGIIAYLLK